MATAAYGATNPAGTDPWPIETTLAKEALSGNPAAHIMLGNYQQAREADTNLYNLSMEGQHAFARKQLEDAMTQARMKLIPELVGKPGGGAFLAGGGIQGVGPGDGGNPAAWAGLGTAGQQFDFAKNIAETGKGIESLSRAGQDLPIQQIPGLQNYQTTGAGKHSDITVEEIKANNALQIAAMKAKNAGAGGGGTGLTIGFDVPNAYGGTDHVSAGKKVPESRIDALREARGLHRVDPQTPAQDLPGGGGARSGSGTSAASTQAERNGVRTPPPQARPPQNAAAGVPALQQRVVNNEAGMQRANPTLYNDYVAGKARNNGKPDVRIEGGKAVLYGGSGRPLAQVDG
jgi:hypothetical protein